MQVIIKNGDHQREYDRPNDTIIVQDAWRLCPACKMPKPLIEFGMRNMGDGTLRNQSRCGPCRRV